MSYRDDLIKTYRDFPDEKIQHLLSNEIQGLTNIAIEVLLDEADKRNLPLDDSTAQFLEEHQHMKRMEASWVEAFQARKRGASDQELTKMLSSLGIGEGELKTYLQRLPKTDDSTVEFEKFFKNKSSTSSSISRIHLIIIFAIATGIMLYGIFTSLIACYVLSVFCFVFGIYKVFKDEGEMNSSDYWLTQIKNEPQNIVWIKPIRETTTLNFVITLDEKNYFQILSNKNKKITLECLDSSENKMFLNGIKCLLPHAHFGYNDEVNDVYTNSPDSFLPILKKEGLYTPLDSYTTS